MGDDMLGIITRPAMPAYANIWDRYLGDNCVTKYERSPGRGEVGMMMRVHLGGENVSCYCSKKYMDLVAPIQRPDCGTWGRVCKVTSWMRKSHRIPRGWGD